MHRSISANAMRVVVALWVTILAGCAAHDGSHLTGELTDPSADDQETAGGESSYPTASSAPPPHSDADIVTAGEGARDDDTLLPPNPLPQTLNASAASGLAQVLFLNFGGVTIHHGAYAADNAQTNTSFIPPNDVVVPPFDHRPWGADRGTVIGRIVGGLRHDFAGYNVTITTKRPRSGPYTMAVVGGTRDSIGQGGNRIGVAPLDAGNSNPNDIIFAMTASLAPYGYDIRHISWLIAHEFGHSIGLRHIAPANAIMNATECHCAEAWLSGATTDGSNLLQDDSAVLRSVFPMKYASGTAAGIVLDGYGGLHPFGGIAVNTTNAPYWSGWDIARSVSVTADKKGGWTLDGYGGIHNWGNAPPIANPAYWSGWDIARALVVLADKKSGYVLDGYGGVHKFGSAPNLTGAPYWGWDVARGLEIHTNANGVADGGWVLDAYGGMHEFGAAPNVGNASYYSPSNEWLAVHKQPSGGLMSIGRWGDYELLQASSVPMRAGAIDWELWDITRDTVPLSP